MNRELEIAVAGYLDQRAVLVERVVVLNSYSSITTFGTAQKVLTDEMTRIDTAINSLLSAARATGHQGGRDE